MTVPATDIAPPRARCSRCSGSVTPHEEGLCAFCRMAGRGDGWLVAHDSRGWFSGYRQLYVDGRVRNVEIRVPCGCGCNASRESTSADPEPAPLAWVDELRSEAA